MQTKGNLNTKIGYLYRDASNYKKWNEVIVAGEASDDDISLIRSALDVDGLFIPEQIGLPLLRPDNTINEDDHCYAELNINDINLTTEGPTISVLWEEVMNGFRDSKENGWRDMEYAVYPHYL